MPFCAEHMGMMEKITETRVDVAEIKATVNGVDKRINGSIDNIEKHVEHSGKWRLMIAGTAITVIMTIFIQIATFLFMWGKIIQKVEDDSEKIRDLQKYSIGYQKHVHGE